MNRQWLLFFSFYVLTLHGASSSTSVASQTENPSLHRNATAAVPPRNAIAPLAAPPPSLARLYLTETKDRTYSLTVGFGTPAQYLRLLLHTGVPHMWIRQCSPFLPLDCRTHAYHPEHSETASETRYGEHYEVAVYPAAYLSGIIASDYVQLGTVQVPDQSFVVYRQPTYSSREGKALLDMDGVFGTGRALFSSLRRLPSAIQKLAAEKAIPESLVSIYAGKHGGGELTIGGVIPGHNLTQHKWIDVNEINVQWRFEVSDIEMFDVFHLCDGTCKAVVDSGTSHIAGPADKIKKINDYLKSFPSAHSTSSSQSCQQRVHSIVQDFFEQRNDIISNGQFCVSIELCNASQAALLRSLSFGILVQHDLGIYLHNFGCAACLALTDFVRDLEAPGNSLWGFEGLLCNWLQQFANHDMESEETDEVSCSRISDFKMIRFRISDNYYPINSPDYTYKRVHPDLSITCHSEFVPYSRAKGNNWILGTSFLRAYHTILDFEANRIGFAPSGTPS